MKRPFHRAFILSGLCCFATLCSAFSVHAEIWPNPDWAVAPAPRSAAMDALEQYAFPPRDEETRMGVRTDALLVVRDGVIVYERYAAPHNVNTPHILWSASKQLFAAVMGVSHYQGRFNLDDPAMKYYPPLAAHPQLTIRHLMRWSSSLAWKEDYGPYVPLTSSVVAMLYTRGRRDMPAFVAAHVAAAPPGTQYMYSSGDSNLLSAVMRGVVGEAAYHDYPWTALFDPLGITSAVWERDAGGTFVASSWAYMSARDFARVGLLLQRGGRWGEAQLIAPEWIEFLSTPFVNYRGLRDEQDEAFPGGQWWLNRAPGNGPRAWPNAPEDMIAALGRSNQTLYISPGEKLVIVRYADDIDGSFQHNELLRLVRAAFVEGKTP